MYKRQVFYFSNNNEYAAHAEAAAEAGFELGIMPMPAPEGIPTIDVYKRQEEPCREMTFGNREDGLSAREGTSETAASTAAE